MLDDDTVPRALARDWRTAPVDEGDRAMLAYVVKLTARPWAVTEEDVKSLRGFGFDDTGILDLVQVAGYYNYVNRLADGLGVELEAHWTDQEMVLTREEFLARKSARRDRGEGA